MQSTQLHRYVSRQSTPRCAAVSCGTTQLRPNLRPSCAAAGNGPNSTNSSSLEDTLSKAGQVAKVKVKEMAQNAQDSARRTWRKLDAEYSIQDNAQRAARRLEEQARDVDQQYNIRRRLRSSRDHVQRMWPVWSKQFREFSGTWYGKGAVLVGLFLLFSSPIFWRLLNLLLIVWWLAIPVGAALLNNAQKKAAERAAAEAEEQARMQNPFADMFKSRASAGMGRGAGRQSGGSTYKQSGPVIDADYTVIDADKNK